MARYFGGTPVESGYYLNTRSFSVLNLPDPAPLPGGPEDAFVRVPWPVLLVAAPIIGGAYLLTYPLVGAAMAAYGLVRKVASAFAGPARDLAANFAPGPMAGEAHLAGKPGEGAAPRHEEIEKVAGEVEEKRRGR